MSVYCCYLSWAVPHCLTTAGAKQPPLHHDVVVIALHYCICIVCCLQLIAVCWMVVRCRTTAATPLHRNDTVTIAPRCCAACCRSTLLVAFLILLTLSLAVCQQQWVQQCCCHQNASLCSWPHCVATLVLSSPFDCCHLSNFNVSRHRSCAAPKCCNAKVTAPWRCCYHFASWRCLLLLPPVHCCHLIFFLIRSLPGWQHFLLQCQSNYNGTPKVMSSSCITILLTCCCHRLLFAFQLLLFHTAMHCVATAVPQCCYLRLCVTVLMICCVFAVAAV